MTTTDRPTVQASKTTLRILEELMRLEGAGVTELAAELDIPKSTAHNHLSTLLESEYVVREGDAYRLGLRFLDLGEHTRNRQELYDIARPEIERLAEETGELANLLVEEHGYGVYLCRAKGDRAVGLDTYAGKRVHLHATSLGKAVLAHTAPDRREEILDQRGLPRRTDRTVTTREALAEELEVIRERGYAVDDGERLAGLRCIAAPITDCSDRALGAISVSAPASRMRGRRFEEEIPERVMSAANVIELNVTYS